MYEVSNLGSIRSLDYRQTYYVDGKKIERTHVGRILKQTFDGKGFYKQVMLSKDGVHKKYLVHRIVATAFVPNPYMLPEVNHLDENKANNAASNLEWCDHRQNSIYGSRKDSVKGMKNPSNKFSERMVRSAREEFIPGDEHHGLTALSKKYGVSRPHMCAILKGKRWSWLE